MKLNLPLSEKGIEQIQEVANKRGTNFREAVIHLLAIGLNRWEKFNFTFGENKEAERKNFSSTK